MILDSISSDVFKIYSSISLRLLTRICDMPSTYQSDCSRTTTGGTGRSVDELWLNDSDVSQDGSHWTCGVDSDKVATYKRFQYCNKSAQEAEYIHVHKETFLKLPLQRLH